MELSKIKQIREMYRNTKNHETVISAFGLNHAQEYAVNIFGRDKRISSELLAEKIDGIKAGMTVGEVAIILGFPANSTL